MTSTKPAETEVIRRVHYDMHYLEVGEYPDVPGYLELRTGTEENAGYFGQVRISMTPVFARELGQALIAAATEQEAKK